MGRKLYPSNPKAPPPKHEPPMTTPDIAGLCDRLQEVVDELIKLDTGPKIRLRRSGPTDIRIEAPTGEDQ